MLRFVTVLGTLLSTALLIQPTLWHALLNALQCSAGCMAGSVALAKAYQRLEEMQQARFLRVAKKIRSIDRRQRIAGCYRYITWALDAVVHLFCLFGTYMVLIYWLKFEQFELAAATRREAMDSLHPLPGSAAHGFRYYWVFSATLANLCYGYVWGNLRRSGFFVRLAKAVLAGRPLRWLVRIFSSSRSGSEPVDFAFFCITTGVCWGCVQYGYWRLPLPPPEYYASTAQRYMSDSVS